MESGARAATDGVLPTIEFSLADNAKSCFMISAFSDLLALSGPPANNFAMTAHITSAAATPISGMLIILGAPICVHGKGNCPIGPVPSTGYRGAVPNRLDSRADIGMETVSCPRSPRAMTITSFRHPGFCNATRMVETPVVFTPRCLTIYYRAATTVECVTQMECVSSGIVLAD